MPPHQDDIWYPAEEAAEQAHADCARDRRHLGGALARRCVPWSKAWCRGRPSTTTAGRWALTAAAFRCYFSVNVWLSRGKVLFGRLEAEAGPTSTLRLRRRRPGCPTARCSSRPVSTRLARSRRSRRCTPPKTRRTATSGTTPRCCPRCFLIATSSAALAQFREGRSGCYAGMTQWTDHVDDMPSGGHGLPSILGNRTAAFWLLLFGHAANFASRAGRFAAPRRRPQRTQGKESREFNGHRTECPPGE